MVIVHNNRGTVVYSVTIIYTVKPLNNEHFGTTIFVRYMEGTKVMCIFKELAKHVISLLMLQQFQYGTRTLVNLRLTAEKA